jgi:hypothetical protein
MFETGRESRGEMSRDQGNARLPGSFPAGCGDCDDKGMDEERSESRKGGKSEPTR